MLLPNQFTKKSKCIFYGCLFVGLFLCFFAIPVTIGDDMVFFAKTRQMNFDQLFQYIRTYGNGRFLGNLSVMVLMKSSLLRALVKAFTLTGITVLLPSLLGLHTIFGISFTALVVLFPGTRMLSNVYDWTAGFSNYVIPVFLLLLSLYLFKYLWQNKGKTALGCAAILILMFLAQFYNEISTVMHLCVCLFLLILSFRNQKGRAGAICFALGSITGGGLMWILPKFIANANDISFYRGFIFDGVAKTLASGFTNANTVVQIFLNNFFVVTAVCAFSLYLLYIRKTEIGGDSLPENEKEPRTSSRKGRKTSALSFVLFATPALLAARLFLYHDGLEDAALVNFVSFVLVVAAFICVIKAAVLYLPEEIKRNALLLLLNAVLSFAPNLIIVPIGSRTVYYCMISFVAYFLYVGKYFFKKREKTDLTAVLGRITKALVFACLFIFFACCLEANTSFVERDRYITEQIEAGADTVTVSVLAHDDLFFDTAKYYKMKDGTYEGLNDIYYRETPGDVKFEIYQGSYNDWKKVYLE